MKYICPLLVVSDIKRSREFYEGLLNQTVKYDFGENVTFEGDFAIHLQSHYKALIGDKEVKQGGNNFELYFEYDDVEQIVERLQEHSVQFVHEIMEQPWHQKVVRVYDPDKHIIEIGESLEYLSYRLNQEGLSLEEISKITYMPVEFIEEAVKKYINQE